jgi:rubrerythrin
MKKKTTDTGLNRTGTAMSPIESKKVEQAALQSDVGSPNQTPSLAAVRAQHARAAQTIGTMPPPANLKGAVRSAATAAKGQKITVFLDLLAERLAFERTGTRLYEALMAKHAAADDHTGGPTLADLQRLRDEEQAHMHLLTSTLVSLGSDPTALTPSANLAAVATSGVLQVLTDPRTTLTEALRAILVIELTDNDAWDLLVQFAQALGHDDLAMRFSAALAEEKQHLEKVRGWARASLEGQAGIVPRKSRKNGVAVSP